MIRVKHRTHCEVSSKGKGIILVFIKHFSISADDCFFLKFIYTEQGNWKIYSEHCQQPQGHGLASRRAEPQLLSPPVASWICCLSC